MPGVSDQGPGLRSLGHSPSWAAYGVTLIKSLDLEGRGQIRFTSMSSSACDLVGTQ